MGKLRGGGQSSKKGLTENVELNRRMVELASPFSMYAWVRALDGKLEDHGKIAEAEFGDGFSKWLEKFNVMLKEVPARVETWNSLKSKFSDRERLDFVSSLYLFTSPDKTAAHVLRDRFRLLKKEIDGLIPTYSKVCKRTQALLNDRRLACVTIINGEWYLKLMEPLHLIIAARQKLTAIRSLASALGSGKIYPQDAALYWLATMMHKATGNYGLEKLANVIEAAYGAHGDPGEIVHVEKLSKRLQRFKERYSSP